VVNRFVKVNFPAVNILLDFHSCQNVISRGRSHSAHAVVMKQSTSAGEVSPRKAGLTKPDPGRPPNRKIRVGSPASLLPIVPHLLGFVPDSSLVVIGAEGAHGQINVTLRYDLPDPPDPSIAGDIAEHAAGVLTAQGVATMIAIGYGPARLVDPLAEALRDLSPRTGFTLLDILRVQDERFSSYLCAKAGCCPPEGIAFDGATGAVSAQTASPGTGSPGTGSPGTGSGAIDLDVTGSRVLADRSELAATVAAVGGSAGESMRRATRLAEDRADKLIARIARTGKRGEGRRLIALAGVQAVTEAIGTYRGGGRLDSDDRVAWLTVVLRDLRVRDDAWARMVPEHREAHLKMWTDIVPRARPGHVAAAASLCAFVAWQCGNGALANIALDRALADQPRYSMAHLLRQVIGSGAPPEVARLPMTPEDVAACYDDLDDQNRG
jgi:Domain of unknown function (DUF4192)